MKPEPVSPELVLVDPELARRERARLEEKAYLQSLHDVAALRRAAESQPPSAADPVRRTMRLRHAASFAKRRLLPATLLCSLAANGLLVAHLVVRGDGQEATQVAVRAVTLTESTPSVAPVLVPSTTVPRTKAAVEREVIDLLNSSPARRLPGVFIDSTTGLVKNNVQVVCRKSKQRQRSFLCAVHPPTDCAGKALYVGYHIGKNGHAAFKWYGYKRSLKEFSHQTC